MAAKTSFALETSLRRLQTDYVDLYMLHAWDLLTYLSAHYNSNAPWSSAISNASTCARPGARDGCGGLVWSPLGSGFLSGKYRPSDEPLAAQGRLRTVRGSSNPDFQKFNDRNWAILAELEAVAREMEQPMSAVALNWIAHRPGVASVIVGATKLSQLQANLRALTFTIPPELSSRLPASTSPTSAMLFHS